MEQLNSPHEAAQWLRARVTGELHCDSRRIRPGDGFIAWPGAATDGRRHVPAALKQGTVATLVEQAGVEPFGFDQPAIPSHDGPKAATGATPCYRGIFSGWFRQDPRDGRYKLLEINARVWWFVEYAGRCGLDVCAMSYLDALGERVEDVTEYPVGARFVQAYFDFPAIRCRSLTGT